MGAFITVVAFIGAAATLVATLAEYWQELVEWVKKCINAVKKLIEGIVYGFKVFITKVSEAIKKRFPSIIPKKEINGLKPYKHELFLLMKFLMRYWLKHVTTRKRI